jgi:hypothetical protein
MFNSPLIRRLFLPIGVDAFSIFSQILPQSNCFLLADKITCEICRATTATVLNLDVGKAVESRSAWVTSSLLPQ